MPTEQTDEQILYHILCLAGISYAQRDEIDDFTAMLSIIV